MPDSTPVQNDCETSADVPITCDWLLAPLHRMAHGRAGNAHSFVTQYPVAVRPAILLSCYQCLAALTGFAGSALQS